LPGDNLGFTISGRLETQIKVSKSFSGDEGDKAVEALGIGFDGEHETWFARDKTAGIL